MVVKQAAETSGGWKLTIDGAERRPPMGNHERMK
uniref:Uncharacterized protein n=1 Tax=Manihot esculenta TaxID=3983 RepID=A0A2C9TZQ9_MANES